MSAERGDSVEVPVGGGPVLRVLVEVQPSVTLAEGGSSGSRSFAPGSRAGSERGFLKQLVRASWFQPCLTKQKSRSQKISVSLSRLESVITVFSTALLNFFVYLLFTFQKSLVNIRLYKCVQFSDTRL